MSPSQPSTPLRIRTATPSSVRAVNRSIVLELIRRRQPVSRAELARITGIFRSSVSEIVDELIADNLVTEERGTSRRGRIPMSLNLNDESVRVLGLNIRPEYSQVAVSGLNGRIHHTVTFPTPADPEQLVASFARAVDHLEFEVDDRVHKGYKRVGIAVPGHVDVSAGKVLWTPTHPELSNFEIANQIQARTGMEVLVDNDCNVGALSELWLGQEKSKDLSGDFAFLNVSDYGAGVGMVINGEPYRGHDAHFAAEFGHMIIDESGLPCPCGRRGCWERYISNASTWERYCPGEPFTLERFEQMLKAASQSDEKALWAVRETARYLSLGVSNIGFALNPSLIVVAGRITAVWNLIRDDVERLFGCPTLQYKLRPARLSADDSLLHGAVCLALREIFAPPKFG